MIDLYVILKLRDFFHEKNIVFLCFNGGLVFLPEC